MAIAALVCGIIGIVLGWFPVINYAALVLAILGIVFGAIAIKNAPADKKGIATAGLVLGIIGTVCAGIGVIACTLCAAAAAAASIPAGFLY
ncbi:MAG: hypothetical protein LBH35_02725 [Treponema sp.]|jgi:hypothetical protein|nr:hypothetical protein [Treponema sp.]